MIEPHEPWAVNADGTITFCECETCEPWCEQCGVYGCCCDWCDECEDMVNPYRHFLEWSPNGIHPSGIAVRAVERGDTEVTDRLLENRDRP